MLNRQAIIFQLQKIIIHYSIGFFFRINNKLPVIFLMIQYWYLVVTKPESFKIFDRVKERLDLDPKKTKQRIRNTDHN